MVAKGLERGERGRLRGLSEAGWCPGGPEAAGLGASIDIISDGGSSVHVDLEVFAWSPAVLVHRCKE